MKFNLITATLITTLTLPLLASACETVMGGCSQEPTHDTSTHMKSQIVNKIEKEKSAANNQPANTNKAKLGSKKSNGAANLMQAVNKAVLK